MPTVRNLKQQIRTGQVVVGLQVAPTMSRADLERRLAQGIYDYLYVDGQHSPLDEAQLVAFCAMAEELDLPVQFRIPHTRHSYLVGRYLDLGPTAIMVPEVTEVATVDEVVRFAYYPSVGERSWGGTLRRKAPAGITDRRGYADWWNDYVVVTIQLESVQAISHARQLARPGVDLVTFGANDLAFSLETHPAFPLRTVDACIENVAAQLAGTPVRLSVSVTNESEREKYLGLGVTALLEMT